MFAYSRIIVFGIISPNNRIIIDIGINVRDDEIILLTLPTPKQEQIALLLKKKNKTYKIICLGGAIRMLCGDEPPAPNIIYKLNLEFLWRLRYETKRRVKRLIESFYFFLKAEIKGKFRNLKEKN